MGPLPNGLYFHGLDMGADPITTEPSPGMMLQASPGKGGFFQHDF